MARSIDEALGALSSADDFEVRKAVQDLEQHIATGPEDRRMELANRLLELRAHSSVKVRQAVAAASAFVPEPIFEVLLAALAEDSHAYVRRAMDQALKQRAVSGKIRSMDDERERLVEHVLNVVAERAGRPTKKLVERAIRREKEYYVRRLHHELTKVMTPLEHSLNVVRDELHRPSRDFHAIEKSNAVARERLAFLLSIMNRARAATDTSALTFEEVSLAGVVDEAIEQLRLRLPARPGPLIVTNSVSPEVKIDLNRHAMLQALQNLLQNAAEAFPDAEAPIVIDVTTKLLRRGSLAVLTIADRGAGMSKESKDLLFVPFGSSKPEGTGLGLLIARRAVEDHGGELHIESEKGKGTNVRIELPAKQLSSGTTV